MENPLTLKTYTYKVVADNRDEVPAVFDSPRYAGTNSSVKIVKDEVKIIDINCALTDVLVEPSFAADIDANFKEWSLTVSNGEGSLVWSKTNGNVGKTGYFQVPVSKTLTWTFTGTNLAGTDYTASDKYENVQKPSVQVLSGLFWMTRCPSALSILCLILRARGLSSMVLPLGRSLLM